MAATSGFAPRRSGCSRSLPTARRNLLRLAWHLGNRHLPVQALDGTLRIRDDHVIAEMVERLGGRITRLDAPFDPETGAYAGAQPDHEH